MLRFKKQPLFYFVIISLVIPSFCFATVDRDIRVQDIRNKQFELLSLDTPTSFGEAYDMAKIVAQKTKIRPAFLLAIFQQELSLEKTDMCYLTDLQTGAGVRIIDGKQLQKVMKPERDIPDFLRITKALHKDPYKTAITCPMSFGWGGAMGPADFIPSTWAQYEKRIEDITGAPANPWNTQDAFWAAGLFLSDSGARSKNTKGEFDAAMIYFSGSAKSPYTFYAKGALAKEAVFASYIKTLEGK
ncbi:MAG: hypothetical protein WCQ32_00820 [bacterium]